MSLFAASLALVILCGTMSDASQLAKPLNDFSASLFTELVKENGDENVFASPFSVSTAMSMLLLGARTTTATELTNGLHYEGVETANGRSIHELFNQLIDDHIRKGSSVSLSNYLLLRREAGGNKQLQQFKDHVKSLYHADVDDVNFVTDGMNVMKKVNKWVSESTRGMINGIMNEPPPPSTAALILNAIYFKGKWQRQFRKSNSMNMTFFNNGKNEKEIEFMTMHEKHFPYKEIRVSGQDVQALELPYEKDSLSMFVLLPKARSGLQKIFQSTDASDELAKAADSLSNIQNRTEVNIHLPKFKLETEYSLNSALSSLGMANIFSGTADFSGISGGSDLHVSAVKHKAVVRVDEEGTEAAAVTSIEVEITSVRVPKNPIEFNADHPFLFYIADKKTGIILFIGKVEKL